MSTKRSHGRTSGVVLECASGIPVHPALWVFFEWLPAGKLVLLAGMPGAGKTGIAMEIAARVSNGNSRRGYWAGGLMAPRGSVIILTYEDDVNTTIMGRLVANGADLSKIHIVRGTERFDGSMRAFDFGKDVEQLLETIDEVGDVVLVIVDPVISVVKGDALKNQEVRESFAPLIVRAESRLFTILGITHFNKGTAKKHPLERITGSGAFVQLARAVLVVVKVEGDNIDALGRKQGLLVRVKNLGPEGDAYLYEIEPCQVPTNDGDLTNTARIVWPDMPMIQGPAKKLIAWAESGGNSGTSAPAKEDEAEDFLVEALSDGPIPTKEIEALAGEAGISSITLVRARKSLGVVSTKERGPDGRMRTVLSLPELGAACRYSGVDMSRTRARRFDDFEDDERERRWERRSDSDDGRQREREHSESRFENRDRVDQVDRVARSAPGRGGSDQAVWSAAADLLDQDVSNIATSNQAGMWNAAADLVDLELDVGQHDGADGLK